MRRPEVHSPPESQSRGFPSRFPWDILAILWLAAALRWVQPGLIEFKYDEAHILGMAIGVSRGGYFPILSGGTSLGIERSALDVYLLALPLAITGGRVEAAVWGMGALGVLAVALTYVLGRRIGGARVGRLAALFMAANPWLVVYDRKLWAHIQVVFSVALLLLAWEVVVRGRGRGAVWFPIFAVLQLLSHVLALVQGISWLGGFLVAPRRWWRRETWIGLVVATVLATPYLRALVHAPRAGGGGAEGIVARVAAQLAARPGGPLPVAWRQAASLFSGDGLASLAALPASHSLWWRLAAEAAPAVLLIIGLGVARVAAWAIGGPRARGGRLLLAWTLGPLLVLGLGPLPVFPQYWTVLLPLPALYLALGLDGIARSAARIVSARPAWGGVGALAGLLIVIWVGSYGSVLSAVAAGAGGATFGVPLQRWQEALAVARSWADRLGTQEIRVAVRGVDPGYESDPAVVAVLIGNPPWARFVAPSSPAALLLSYDRPSLYLWTIEAPETEQMLERLGEMVWEGKLADDLPPARLYRLPPASQTDLGIVRLQPEPVFDVGMALMGYAFPERAQAGQPLQVTLVWRVLEPPPEVRARDVTAFNHILNEAGERVAQVDGLALLSRDWWPGDVLVQPYRIQVPAGTYRWRVGLYSRVDGGRAQVSTGGDFVDLGPLVVGE